MSCDASPSTAGRSNSELPLLLLDVDGVVNDLRAHQMLGVLGDDQAAGQLGVTLLHSHGYRLAVPHYMPELIRELAGRADTWWCTTWRGWANDELAAHLRVGPFPVIDPEGTDRFSSDWKVDCVRPLAKAALAAGRAVVWIEDFEGEIPDIEGIVLVDTTERGVLTWADLPLEVFD